MSTQSSESKSIDELIFQTLNGDEKALLDKINLKIKEHLEKNKLEKQKIFDEIATDEPIDFSAIHPECIPQQHATTAPQEITIKVNAEVSNIDNKGFLTDVIDVFQQNYHIPVPPSADYNYYIQAFFDRFHKDLADACSDVDKQYRKQ